MRLSYGFEQRQQQVQKLAPRMIQSMEILQLPILALQERIDQEMNENPMLELDEPAPTSEQETTPEPAEKEKPVSENEKELVVSEDNSNKEDFERLADMDNVMPNTFDDFRPSSNRIQDASDRQHDLMANAAARPESLNDYLLHQLAELDIDSRVEAIAETIISCLDAREGGYFKGSLRDILPATHKEADLELAEQALAVVQSLEPNGVGARSLQECLLLQLTDDFPHYDEMRTLIGEHLEDLAANRLPQVQKQTGYSVELIQEVREEMHRLNPKPGAAFMSSHVPNVTPDVFIDVDDEGNYHVRLENTSLPPLRISEYYRRRLSNPSATPEEIEFIKGKINGAQWLIDAIQQRRSTLKKVATEIVEHQERFLKEGPEFIEPLKMQQIAERVGVHVTTISRAVDDKWIQTPRGIMPLRRFFVGGTRSEEGDDVAWDTIRLKLQEVIDQEDKSKPYSDDELGAQLKNHGLSVARRTITKYRKKMGIPSSRQRRDWSKNTDKQ